VNTNASERNIWQELQELVAGDPELQRYMQLSFNSFHSTGNWPDIERLQRQLLREHEPLDLYKVADRIPGDLGTNPVRVENRCQLTIAGIALCDGSNEEVEDFMRILHLAVQKYLADNSDHDSPESISSDDLRDTLGMTPLAIRRSFQMIEWEPFIAGGDRSIDGGWRRNVGNLNAPLCPSSKLCGLRGRQRRSVSV
jgi:hypothetical protein